MRDEIIFKMRLSSNDLERFKIFLENHSDDLTLTTKRKRNLSILLDEENANDTNNDYRVFFSNFSRIDGFPILNVEKIISDFTVKELIRSGQLIDFEIKDEDYFELEQIIALEDNYNAEHWGIN